jgi:dephospho-CoA kinase
MKIIGITGTIGAGKTTIVNYLCEKKGFKYFSVREYLICELKKRDLEINRDNMRNLGNELRENFGPSYIVEQLYEKAINSKNNVVIESIRCPGEVFKLKEKKDFVLLSVDCDIKERFLRIKKRKTKTDFIDFETFEKQEKKEFENSDPNKQNLKKCIDLSDFKIDNNGSFNELYEQINLNIRV